MSIVARVIVTLLLCSVTIGRANPLDSTDTVKRPPNTNPFDGGQINSCVELNDTVAMMYCGINYLVPAYVAAIAPILVSEIRGALVSDSRSSTEACSTTLKEVLCSQKFPRCRIEESGEVYIEQTYTQSCEQRLQQNCSTSDYNELRKLNTCGFPNVTMRDTNQLAASPCQPVADYGFDFLACHTVIDADLIMVTPWMFELLKQKDAVVHSALHGSLSGLLTDDTCRRKWAAYHCQSVGRCSSDGSSIELVNTMEDCEMLLQCFSHIVVDAFSESIPCSLWPNRPLYPSVEPTVSSSSSTELPSTSSSKRPATWPPPAVIIVDSGSTLVKTTNFLTICLTFLSLLVFSCLQ